MSQCHNTARKKILPQNVHSYVPNLLCDQQVTHFVAIVYHIELVKQFCSTVVPVVVEVFSNCDKEYDN